MSSRFNEAPGRRRVLGAAMAGAAGTLSSGTSRGDEAPARSKPPGYYRFGVGNIVVTVVSDGRVFSGDPKRTFKGGSAEEVDAVLKGNFLETDRVVLEENAIVADFGTRRVLFDCGVGRSTLFGRSGGHLLTNLAAAGIPPGSIDAVMLSHGHPDHIGALVDESGVPNFPNAQLYLSQAEYEFWTGTSRTLPGLAPFHALAQEQLAPNRARLQFIVDGQEVLPGILAVASPGHTIGHMHFLLGSAGQMLAWTADLSRHPILGLEKRWTFAGDYDPAQSLDTLDRFMGQYADERTLLLSYHYPWPGLGHVVRQGDRFRYIPSAMDLT